MKKLFTSAVLTAAAGSFLIAAPVTANKARNQAGDQTTQTTTKKTTKKHSKKHKGAAANTDTNAAPKQ